MLRKAYDVQRDFALGSGLRSEIIWDALTTDQHEILMQKIITMFPHNGKKYRKATDKMHQDIFKSIWSQRKYTNGTLLSAIVYVLVAAEETPALAELSTSYSCHPVFRTRKCMSDANGSTGFCMIFIDETGRVYKNWKTYLKNNVLPKGIIIAPKNGVYTFDANDNVILEYAPTAASSTATKVLTTSDNVASVSGVVAAVPIVTALAFPVAAPILVAASAVTVAAAGYCTIRSAMNLTDRGKHGQSLALSDRAARNSWIGVVGGVVGLGASGATRALTLASKAGKNVTLASKLAINGANVTSTLLSATGVVNGIYDLVLDDQELSSLDVLQLSSSLLIFTHSINNLRIASKLIQVDNRGSTIRQEYRFEIRKTLTKIVSQACSRGLHRADNIRPLNNIPTKDVLFNLDKTHSNLNRCGSDQSSDMATASKYIPKLMHRSDSEATTKINIQYLAKEYGCKFVQYITNSSSFLDVLDAMARYLSESSFFSLINFAKYFIEESSEITSNTFISTEMLLYKMFMYCVSNIDADFINRNLESKKSYILKHIRQYYESLNSQPFGSIKHKCRDCRGHYYVCKL